jgi:hypothetical protein
MMRGGATLPLRNMQKYTLLKHSISGPEGAVIEADMNLARQLAVNGIVDLDEPLTKTSGPDVVKVDGPTELKRRGRPAKNASDTTK